MVTGTIDSDLLIISLTLIACFVLYEKVGAERPDESG